MSYSEITVCLTCAISVWLTARNNMHTWWIGIIGSILYGWIFWSVQFYADVTLRLSFIATSTTGQIHWLKGWGGDVLSVRRTQAGHFFLLLLCAVVVASGYGLLLHTFTDAWAPWLDSLILAFSVPVQFILMGGRIENWFVWLAVNVLAMPLYMMHGLNLTASLYFLF